MLCGTLCLRALLCLAAAAALVALAVAASVLARRGAATEATGQPSADGAICEGAEPLGTSLATDSIDFRKAVDRAADTCYTYIDGLPSKGCPVMAHTALWRAYGVEEPMFANMVRKVRVMVMSFIATQSEDARLWFWVREADDILPMRQALNLNGVRGSDRVAVRSFDQVAVRPGAAQQIDISAILRTSEDTLLPRALDVARYMLLDAYGGIWLDADVLVLRDLSPLSGIDFGYTQDWGDDPIWQAINMTTSKWLHGQVANNAVIGVRSPGSAFTQELLARIAPCMHDDAESYFQFGPALVSQLPDHVFHPLPGCFFEPFQISDAGNQAPDALLAPRCDEFFQPSDQSAKSAEMLAAKSASFTYHWHNRWDEDVSPDSPFAMHAARLAAKLG